MAFPPASPFLSAGAGSSIPISAGGGTSGDAFSGNIGPISVGGLFSSDANSGGFSPQTLLLFGALAIAGFFIIRKL